MPEINLHPYFDHGQLKTDDEALNRIIRSVELETGTTIIAATPAVEFGESPDDKVYLLLLTIYDSEGRTNESTYRDFEVKIGRQETYDYLKDLIKREIIDPSISFVIAGSAESNGDRDDASFDSKAITVFRFMKVMRDEKRVLDNRDDFDIDDYDHGGYEFGEKDKTIFEI